MEKDLLDIRLIEQVITKIFLRSSQLAIERVAEGISTYVYRIDYTSEIFYLRVLPEAGASFASEVYAHQLLRDMQVKVPEVVHFEHCNELLQRSIMVVSEIKGRPINYCSAKHDQKSVLLEAGRDLAVINSVPVKHFGWIQRDSSEVTYLEAEHPSYRAFLAEHLESDLATLKGQVLTKSQIMAIRQILNRFDSWLNEEQSWLAHGDFDVAHIYQDSGRYTGIIDFGEIRGANALYDLGHFKMHDGESLPAPVLPYLIEGYKQVASLPSDYQERITFTSLLIAIRALARAMSKHQDIRNHQGLRSITRDIRLLLA